MTQFILSFTLLLGPSLSKEKLKYTCSMLSSNPNKENMNPKLSLGGSARTHFCVSLVGDKLGKMNQFLSLPELGIIVALLFCFS